MCCVFPVYRVSALCLHVGKKLVFSDVDILIVLSCRHFVAREGSNDAGGGNFLPATDEWCLCKVC